MHRNAWIIVAALVAVHLTLDVLAMQADSWWGEAVTVGFVVGQMGTIAIWTATARVEVWRRLSCGILLSIGVWYALVGGARLTSSYMDLAGGLALGLFVLLLFLVPVVLLGIAARLARLSLRMPSMQSLSAATAETPQRQFRLLHLFVITGIVGLVLGLGRVVIPAGELRNPMPPFMFFVLPRLIIGLASLIAIVLPSIWAAYRDAKAGMGCAVVWIFYIPFATVVEFAVWSAFDGGSLLPGIAEFGTLALFNATQSLSVVATWLALRHAGFRFVRLLV